MTVARAACSAAGPARHRALMPGRSQTRRRRPWRVSNKKPHTALSSRAYKRSASAHPRGQTTSRASDSAGCRAECLQPVAPEGLFGGVVRTDNNVWKTSGPRFDPVSTETGETRVSGTRGLNVRLRSAFKRRGWGSYGAERSQPVSTGGNGNSPRTASMSQNHCPRLRWLPMEEVDGSSPLEGL
jgi:hypothetical protein